jgi:hypothetical protein
VFADGRGRIISILATSATCSTPGNNLALTQQFLGLQLICRMNRSFYIGHSYSECMLGCENQVTSGLFVFMSLGIINGNQFVERQGTSTVL